MASKVAPPHVSVDPVSVVVITLSAVMGIATIKLLAYRYHGHPLSQAVLLLL
jgi:hypothetical protein